MSYSEIDFRFYKLFMKVCLDSDKQLINFITNCVKEINNTLASMIKLKRWKDESSQKENSPAEILYATKNYCQNSTNFLTSSVHFCKAKDHQSSISRKTALNPTIISKKVSLEKRKISQSVQPQQNREPLIDSLHLNTQSGSISHIEKLKLEARLLQQESNLESLRFITYCDKETICESLPTISSQQIQKKLASLKNPRRIVKGRPQMAISGKKSIMSNYKRKSKPGNIKSCKHSPYYYSSGTSLSEKAFQEILSKIHSDNKEDRAKKSRLNNNPAIVYRTTLATIF